MRSVVFLLGGRAHPLDAVAARWLATALRRELARRQDHDADVGLSVAWGIELVLDEGSGYMLDSASTKPRSSATWSDTTTIASAATSRSGVSRGGLVG
jgi:hypothetical protein